PLQAPRRPPNTRVRRGRANPLQRALPCKYPGGCWRERTTQQLDRSPMQPRLLLGLLLSRRLVPQIQRSAIIVRPDLIHKHIEGGGRHARNETQKNRVSIQVTPSNPVGATRNNLV